MNILYTDSAFVWPSKFGIVIDFCIGVKEKYEVITSIGMSTEHTRAFIKLLSKELIRQERHKKNK